MPRTFLPYMFLSFTTPNCVHSVSSASDSSSNGSFILLLKASCDFTESRETPKISAPAFLKSA